MAENIMFQTKRICARTLTGVSDSEVMTHLREWMELIVTQFKIGFYGSRQAGHY